MRQTRIYVDCLLAPQQKIFLPPAASHHIAKVLRCEIGEAVILFNGQGGEYTATIFDIKKHQVTVSVDSFMATKTESPVNIHLAQALLLRDKMDLVIQKAVELGVTEITPIKTARVNFSLDEKRLDKRLDHWRAVIHAACEQSGRTAIPILHEIESLADWMLKVEADQKWILSPYHGGTFAVAPAQHHNNIILVGPEGGFTEEEVAHALQQGFSPLCLGPRILRTETAGIVAAALLQHRVGDL